MLNSDQINLFYHPTITIFLDDDPDFFSYIQFKIGKTLCCKYFNDVEQALNYSHLAYQKLQLSYPIGTPSNTPVGDALFSSQRPLDKQRFFEPSVFVVDYQMPGVNGLEICKQITNPYIKKVLLTGVADENVAIKALNEGIIDYYIHKGELELATKIITAINMLQQQYFAELIKKYPFYFQPSQINDSVFGRYFSDVCEKNNIVEYYFMDSPMGFLMLDSKGSVFILLAYTEGEVEAHIEYCQDQSAPTDLLTQLETRESIAFFSNSDHYYYDGPIQDWRIYLHPVTRVESEDELYYCSLITFSNIKALPEGYKALILTSQQNLK